MSSSMSYGGDYSTMRAQSALLFNSAMPPLLRSHGGASGVGLRDVSIAPPSAFLPVPSRAVGSASSLWMGGDPQAILAPSHHLLGSPSAVADLSSSRHAEASLLRREIELRSEFHRLRAEEHEQTRLRVDQQRRQEEAEERRRLMAAAREREEQRAKRIEEQQERLLQRERELEEWKVERMKEADARRQKLIEEEDRQREIQHQRELARIKEEADTRAASHKQAEELDKVLTKSIAEAQDAMARKLHDELATRDAAHRAELQQREQEWTARVQSMEVARASEMADLTHRLQQDQDRAVRSEHQLSEARDQLQRLITEIEGLRQQRLSASANDASLVETHKTTIARLQQAYEDDKREAQRAFHAERERLRFEQDRRVQELKDSHASQLRAKAEQVSSLEAKLAQAERDLVEAKAKIALNPAGTGNDPYGYSETSRLKDELRDVKHALEEAEEQKKRLERRQRECDERADAHAATLQSIQAEYHNRQRQTEKELEDARKEGAQLKLTLRNEREAHEEELTRLRRQIREAEEAAVAQSSREAESSLQKVRERLEGEKQQLENEKQQLTRKWKTAEEELASVQRQHEATQRELTTIKVDLQQRERSLEEKAAALKRMEGDVENKSALEYELRDAKARNERLLEEHKLEKERLRAQYDATSAAKDKDVEELRKELAESRRLVQSLRDEVSNSKFGKDEYQQKLTRDLAEKEGALAQLRRELEAAKRGQEDWKSNYESLQRQKEKATQNLEQSLRAREEEVRAVTQKLNTALEEKVAAELALRSQETRLLSSASRDGETQRVLQEREETIARLNAEVKELREAQMRLRVGEQELRHELSVARSGISPVTTPSHPPAPLSAPSFGFPTTASASLSPTRALHTVPEQRPLGSLSLSTGSPGYTTTTAPATHTAAAPHRFDSPDATPSASLQQSMLASAAPAVRPPTLTPHLLAPELTSPTRPPPPPSQPPSLPIPSLAVPPPPPPTATTTVANNAATGSTPHDSRSGASVTPTPTPAPVPVPSLSSWLSPPTYSSSRPAAPPLPTSTPLTAGTVPPPPTTSAAVTSAAPAAHAPHTTIPVPTLAPSTTSATPARALSDSLTSPLTIPVPSNLTTANRPGTTNPSFQVGKPGSPSTIPVSVPVPAGTLSHNAVPVPVVPVPTPAPASSHGAVSPSPSASLVNPPPVGHTLGAIPIPTTRTPTKAPSPPQPPSVPAPSVGAPVQTPPPPAPVPVPKAVGGYFGSSSSGSGGGGTAAAGWPTIPVPSPSPASASAPSSASSGIPVPAVPAPVATAPSATPPPVPVPVPVPSLAAAATSSSGHHHHHHHHH